MLFWILCGAVLLAVTLFLTRALLTGGRKKEHPAFYDLAVYRDQLKEVERDKSRGVISEEDAERLRINISRKVLRADAQIAADAESLSNAGPKAFIGITILLVILIGGGFASYWQLGQPGYQDMGLKSRIADAQETRENRASQSEAEAELPALPPNSGDTEYVQNLIGELREMVAARPNDIQGLKLLVSNEANLGNAKQAYEALARLVSLLGDEATAEEFVTLAELQIIAANGYVSPEAEAALTQTIQLEEDNPVAKYYLGLMFAQTGRPDVAFRVWRNLLNEGPDSAPWIPVIRSQIVDLSEWAGVSFELPPIAELAGPTSEDVAAAQEMTAEDQQDFIKSMVAQLSERLANEGGSAAEWSRLISSLGVLGDTEKAKTVWNEAMLVFAADPDGLETVRASARRAGVAE